MNSITPIIGKKHRMRNGNITSAIIVSSKGVSADYERYPYMLEGNTDDCKVWATEGQWDDRGSEWDWDIVEVIE